MSPENNLLIGKIFDPDDENEDITYSLLDGGDSNLTVLASDGTLRFKNAPDYENAGDFDNDNTYNLANPNDQSGGFALRPLGLCICERHF